MRGQWRGAESVKMTEELTLDTLPTEVLLIIFDYCDVIDLIRLSSLCKRFHSIIYDETLWIKESRVPLVTNQFSDRFCDRCNPLLNLRNKWQVSHNWLQGKYNRVIIYTDRVNTIPCLRLTENVLWWSGGNKLYGYHRDRDKTRGPQIKRFFTWHHLSSDISKFVVRDGSIISGHRNGVMGFWLKGDVGYSHFEIDAPYASSINAIDEIPETIITGAADGVVQIWPGISKIYNMQPLFRHHVYDRIWSLGIDPGGTIFAVGSSGTKSGPPLRIFDIESCRKSHEITHNWRYGAGVLDLVWENPNCLLSCGYDTYIKKWDLRSGTCVASWPDPTDAALYCLSSDYKYTMISGTQYNGKAVLWDQRQSKYIQLYFMNFRRTSSPIYSLAFDSSRLYGATDRQLVEFTFTGSNNRPKDYRQILT